MAQGSGNLTASSSGGNLLTIKRNPDAGLRDKGVVVKLSGVDLALAGKKVLDGLDWQVQRGENWVVVGPNGAGKTTLLLLLNGYLWPQRGRASILGKQFGTVDLRELRASIGFVSPYMEDWFPEDESVSDVIASGASASVRLWRKPSLEETRYATVLAKRVGCGGLLRKEFGQLSQGEKRRITIARAMMAKPLLITLDEPCSGLDIPGRESFLSTLSKIARGNDQTMVYITHRVEEIPAGFTHALLLRKGRVVAKGKLHSVLNGKNLTRCFGVQVKVTKWRSRYYAMVDH